MRIAVVSTPFVAVPPPRYGGTELVVSDLVLGLAARGHEVTLYATGDSKAPVRVRARYETAIWPPSPYHELNHAAFAMYDLLASSRMDVIHGHVAPALVFARLMDAPIVHTIHHEKDEPLSALYRDAVGPSVTLVAISERQRELLGDDLRARVVHHGLDPRRYPLGRGHGGYAAFLGRFAREKGVHAAIDAAQRVGVPIRLAGSPHWKDEAYFKAEVEPRLRKNGVAWRGEAAHDFKVELLGGAVATLFPIGWEEPFGLVMVESMLCGTPVLAFPRGSAPEVVDAGVTGWLVADVDEMAWRLIRLARGTDVIDRPGCRARAAERFGLARMVDAYLDVYAEAAGLARSAGAPQPAP